MIILIGEVYYKDLFQFAYFLCLFFFFFLNVPQCSKDQTTVLLLVYTLVGWASFCEESWTVTPRYFRSVNTEQEGEQKDSLLLKVLKGKIKKRNILSCPNSWQKVYPLPFVFKATLHSLLFQSPSQEMTSSVTCELVRKAFKPLINCSAKKINHNCRTCSDSCCVFS